MGQIESEHPELFALEFGKFAESDFVYTPAASTKIYQSAPNLVRMYMTTRAQMSLIMDLNGPELSELFALKLENLPYLSLFTLSSANIDQSLPNLVTIYMPIKSQMSLILRQSFCHGVVSVVRLSVSPFVFFLFSTYSLHCRQVFVKLAQFVYIINSLNPIDFEKNIRQSVKEK